MNRIKDLENRIKIFDKMDKDIWLMILIGFPISFIISLFVFDIVIDEIGLLNYFYLYSELFIIVFPIALGIYLLICKIRKKEVVKI